MCGSYYALVHVHCYTQVEGACPFYWNTRQSCGGAHGRSLFNVLQAFQSFDSLLLEISRFCIHKHAHVWNVGDRNHINSVAIALTSVNNTLTRKVGWTSRSARRLLRSACHGPKETYGFFNSLFLAFFQRIRCLDGRHHATLALEGERGSAKQIAKH